MEWYTINKTEWKKCWHYWFAWHPIVVKYYPDGGRKWVWLKRVLRRGKRCFNGWDEYWEWEYREVKES